MKRLSLYVHIPFCHKKCHYCDFLSAPPEKEMQKRYVEALLKEIKREAEAYKAYCIDTLFFGGGTPSILSAAETEEIMDTLRMSFFLKEAAEITMEVNPGTVDREKLKEYQKLGINRLSVGLQSANEKELKELGRIHTWQDFQKTWQRIRESGFTNVNIDVMSALPGQTMESYEDTLKKVLALEPEHLSAYSLIVEEGTPFFERFGTGQREEGRLPDEEADRRMYERTGEMLKEAGYERYEISNYSRPGYECLHNIGYWTGKEYLGLGLGASSLISHRRFSRETKLEAYIDKSLANESTVIWQQRLDEKEQMEEFMFLGLRLAKGVSQKAFAMRFNSSIEEIYGKQLQQLQKNGLIYSPEADRLALTPKGIDVSNQVFVAFL